MKSDRTRSCHQATFSNRQVSHVPDWPTGLNVSVTWDFGHSQNPKNVWSADPLGPLSSALGQCYACYVRCTSKGLWSAASKSRFTCRRICVAAISVTLTPSSMHSPGLAPSILMHYPPSSWGSKLDQIKKKNSASNSCWCGGFES